MRPGLGQRSGSRKSSNVPQALSADKITVVRFKDLLQGKQDSLESGWGLINVHSLLIYACKRVLEYSCHAGFDNANCIHPASCCSVVVVCVAACRIMVFLWEYYVP